MTRTGRTSSRRSNRAGAERLCDCERHIADGLELDVDVVVRTGDELAEVVERNPLGDVAVNPKRYQVSSLSAPLDDETVSELAALAVESERLVAVGRVLHGGPGSFDHSYFKPDFERLSQVGQVVYLDLRGHGRSEWGDPSSWSFEICADDIRAFCDALGIARPVVYGHSLGGFVAMLYAARHPEHPAALVLQSTFARFDLGRVVEEFRRAGGDEVAAWASSTPSRPWPPPASSPTRYPKAASGSRFSRVPATSRRRMSRVATGRSSSSS